MSISISAGLAVATQLTLVFVLADIGGETSPNEDRVIQHYAI